MPHTQPKPAKLAHMGFPSVECLNHMKFLTFTLRPYFHERTLSVMYYRTIQWLLKRIARVVGNGKPYWKLVPEVTKDGILHYHLLIKTTNHLRLASLKHNWHRLFGRVHEEPVYDPVSLVVYMRKQNMWMSHNLRPKLPLTLILVTHLRIRKFMKHLTKRLVERKRAIKQVNLLMIDRFLDKMLRKEGPHAPSSPGKATGVSEADE